MERMIWKIWERCSESTLWLLVRHKLHSEFSKWLNSKSLCEMSIINETITISLTGMCSSRIFHIKSKVLLFAYKVKIYRTFLLVIKENLKNHFVLILNHCSAFISLGWKIYNRFTFSYKFFCPTCKSKNSSEVFFFTRKSMKEKLQEKEKWKGAKEGR